MVRQNFELFAPQRLIVLDPLELRRLGTARGIRGGGAVEGSEARARICKVAPRAGRVPVAVS